MDQHHLSYSSSTAPTLAVVGSRMYLAWQGQDANGSLWWGHVDQFDDWNNATWSDETQIYYPATSPVTLANGRPSFTEFQSQLFVAYSNFNDNAVHVGQFNPVTNAWTDEAVQVPAGVNPQPTNASSSHPPTIASCTVAGAPVLMLAYIQQNSVQAQFSSNGTVWSNITFGALPASLKPVSLVGGDGWALMFTIDSLGNAHAYRWNISQMSNDPEVTIDDLGAFLGTLDDVPGVVSDGVYIHLVYSLQKDMRYARLPIDGFPGGGSGGFNTYITSANTQTTPAIGFFGENHGGGLYAAWKGEDDVNSSIYWGPVYTFDGKYNPNIVRSHRGDLSDNGSD